jgi:hypothetical protein
VVPISAWFLCVPAASLGREALPGQLSDDRVLGIRAHPLLEQLRGLFDQANSVSNSWIRRLAAASSTRSLVEVPGLTPRSMRS